MKRSQINARIAEAIAFAESQGFRLPPFAFWSPSEWRARGPEADEIRDCLLGWDLTDFGSGDFARIGLTLFTLRNGRHGDPRYPKPYCEKMMISEAGQVTPLHFHWSKTEDIINRGGAEVVVQLYPSTPEEGLAESAASVATDGVQRTVEAGGLVRLRPGESICLPPRLYHQFWGEGGAVLLGEVSTVNDDAADNRFYQPVGRFPSIEEDEEPRYLLCTEYPPASS